MIQQIKIQDLAPHPDNRPLGINQEKVEQIAAIMRTSGYDESKPIKARPHDGGYQIIEGEHRWRAAQAAGLEAVPVFVVDIDDEDALIHLVAGNTQTGNHKLDIGYIALKLCQKDSKKGISISAFAERIGQHEKTVRTARNGAEVRRYLEQSDNIVGLHENDAVYYEWSKCNQSDWPWLYKTTEQTLEAIEISKRIRAIDAAAVQHAAKVLNLTAVKQECATAKEKHYTEWISVLEAIEDCAGKLPAAVTLYRYNIKKQKIETYEYEACATFLGILKEIKQISRADVFRHYTQRLDTIRQQTQEQAQKDKEYYEDEANRQAAEERARAEWEAFVPQERQWYQVGRHWLFCGDNRDPYFIERLPQAAFAFADPPYNAGVDEWDQGFVWEQDYLIEKANVVAVTPGGWQANELYKQSKMPYIWELACWIANGMTHGKCGYANWIKIAVFAKPENKPKIEQDFLKVTIKTSETTQTEHKGRKPYQLMEWLIDIFSKEGDIIIDPFGGSGTTLLQCEKMGRICYTAEVDPQYCKDIIKRHKNEIINS